MISTCSLVFEKNCYDMRYDIDSLISYKLIFFHIIIIFLLYTSQN